MRSGTGLQALGDAAKGQGDQNEGVLWMSMETAGIFIGNKEIKGTRSYGDGFEKRMACRCRKD